MENDKIQRDLRSFLQKSAFRYHSQFKSGWEGLYKLKRARLYRKLSQDFVGTVVLELGCADGEITQYLVRDFERVVVVDGVQQFIDEVSARIGPNDRVTYECALFEKYVPSEKFDSVMIVHVLEHLEDPVALLRRAREWLTPGGRIFAAVPNALSVHRRVGVHLSMLPSVDALNEQDIIVGHKRVYKPDAFRADIQHAGYQVIRFGGVMLKLFPNRDIERDWSPELIEAFFAVGDELPELCSVIYIVAEPLK